MPAWVFIAGRVGNAIVVALLMLVLIAVIGRVLYAVAIPWSRLPAILVTLVVGAASFCLPRHRPDRGDPEPGRRRRRSSTPCCCRSTSSPASSSPTTSCPSGVIDFANHFPIRHFFEAFFNAYLPGGGAGVDWGNLAVVAVWGVAGLLLAIRFFRWTPRSG